MNPFLTVKKAAPLPEAKVISFLNQKGGVGKTTLLFQMSFALKELGKKVLCIDMDPQANLTMLFRNQTDPLPFSIFHLLINHVKELRSLHQPVMLSDLRSEYQGIHFLPAGQELSGMELTVSQVHTFPKQLLLRRFLEKSGLKNEFDFILIDAPPTLGLIMVNLACASDGLLVPFRPDQFSSHGLTLIQDLIAEITEMDLVVPPRISGFLPNMIEERRKQEVFDFELIKTQLNGKGEIYPSLRNKAALSRAMAVGKNVFEYSSKEYKELQDCFLDWGRRLIEHHRL